MVYCALMTMSYSFCVLFFWEKRLLCLCWILFTLLTLNHLLFSRDALITCIVNTLTCLTAGVLVFSILGYMAHLQEKTVQEVARSGPGLVFLTYPELVLSLPGSFIWAILFFAMLLVSSTFMYWINDRIWNLSSCIF